MRFGGDRGVLTKSADRKQSDFFSIGEREKARIASLPGWCFNSDGLNLFSNQVRRGIVRCTRAKIERVVICQAHCVKAGPAEQLRGFWRSAKCISGFGASQIR